ITNALHRLILMALSLVIADLAVLCTSTQEVRDLVFQACGFTYHAFIALFLGQQVLEALNLAEQRLIASRFCVTTSSDTTPAQPRPASVHHPPRLDSHTQNLGDTEHQLK